jgi:serine/threonine-protein kinase HipA
MTSEQAAAPGSAPIAVGPATSLDRLYVWLWLPGATTPVVAGVLSRTGSHFAGEEVLTFTYASSYRARPQAVPLFTPELPLTPGTFDPTVPGRITGRTGAVGMQATSTLSVGATPPSRRRSPLPMHGCLRDAAPDAWGRRVINLRLAGNPEADLSELAYLAESRSDRIGSLDFQESATDYVPRGHGATLEQLMHMAELVEAGQPVPSDLAAAADHGTSIGGARPKALLEDGSRHLIAKFPSSTDTRPVVKAEAAAMLLAARVGITVAPVEVHDVAGRDTLLVERFDRPIDGSRRQMLSALTILGYDALGSRHSSYAELAEAIRSGPWTDTAATLRELYTRLVFNVCVGNNDDHLRNHAAFWDGHHLELTPAYDLSPQPRSTAVSTQAIGVARDGRRYSQLWLCREVAGDYLLTPADAQEIIDHVVATIRHEWADVCDQARLTTIERASLWQREFLNPYIFYSQP